MKRNDINSDAGIPSKILQFPATLHPYRQAPVESRKKRQPNLMREGWAIARDFFGSAQRNRVLCLFGAVSAVLVANSFGQTRFNDWQGALYRTIEQRRFGEIPHELEIAVLIIAGLVTAVVSQIWLVDRMKICLRRWLFHSMMTTWLLPGRAYRISVEANEPINPDQRIQEDARVFSEASADLGVGFIQSSFLFITFVGVLWRMSAGVNIGWSGHSLIIPGYMVWAAIAYAVMSATVTGLAGRPLIGLNAKRFAEEAKLRFSVMRASECAESISFYGGEADEKQKIVENFESLTTTQSKLSFALARMTWFTSGTAWILIAVPTLVALPGYVQRVFDLGGLLVVVGAFNQVQNSLRWFVDNFARFAEWRATLSRISEFREAMLHDEHTQTSASIIRRETHNRRELRFDRTRVKSADGITLVAHASTSIKAGERVLISGPSGSGKSTLLRALGGLWPWGSGRILTPQSAMLMFLPQKPYLPLGTLQSALQYPFTDKHIPLSAMERVLRRVNLLEILPSLEVNDRWDQILSLGQQQRLAFARLLLHRPDWVFLDEATSALDEANQDLMMSIFRDELPEAAVISVGHRPGLEAYHSRRLHLSKSDVGSILLDQSIAGEALPTSRLRVFLRDVATGLGKAKLES